MIYNDTVEVPDYNNFRICLNGSYCNNSDPDSAYGVTPPDSAEVEKLENVVKIVVPVSKLEIFSNCF